MNIFSKLSRQSEVEETDLTADEIRAAAKAERIEFHARSVRNGPVKFNAPTAGQQRRAEKRALKTKSRKAFRSEVQNFHEKQRVAMITRGQLQAAGALSYIDGHEAPEAQQISATAWIVQRYGTEVTIDGVGTGHASFRSADIVDAMKQALLFYTRATGHIVALRSDYVPAISLLEGDIVEGVSA